MLKRIFPLLIVATATWGCTKQPPVTLLKSEVPAVVNQHIYPLGTGYFALIDEFFDKDACVTSPVLVPAYAPEATLSAGVAESDEQTENRLRSGAEVHGGVDIGIAKLGVDGRIEISTALVDHDLKTSVFTTFTSRAGNVVLLNPKLTDHGKDLLAGTDAVARVKRLFDCGDEFIYQVQLGNRLHLGLEFAFASKEIKNDFNLKVDGSAKVAKKKIKRTFLQANQHFNIEQIVGTVRVIFEQEGGDLAAFAAAKAALPSDCFVAGKHDEGVGAKDAFLDGYNKCVDAYKNLLQHYALEQFPQQVKGLEYAATHDLDSSGYAALRYYTMPYEQAGYPEFRSVIKDLPPPLQTFLETKVKPFVLAVKKLMGGLRAVENISGNTSSDPVVAAVKGALQSKAGAALPDFAALGQVLKAKAKSKLTACRAAIVAALEADYAAGGQTFPRLTEEATECGGDLTALQTEIDQFNSKTGAN